MLCFQGYLFGLENARLINFLIQRYNIYFHKLYFKLKYDINNIYIYLTNFFSKHFFSRSFPKRILLIFYHTHREIGVYAISCIQGTYVNFLEKLSVKKLKVHGAQNY